MKYHQITKYLPVIFWMIVIFYFSSKQTTGIGGTSLERLIFFKSLHVIEYAILSILWYLPLNNTVNAGVLSFIYAASDEFHQSFVPGRTPKVTDTFFDLLGIIIGLVFIKVFQNHFKKLKNKLH